MDNTLDMTGKVILLTGGAGSIGLSLCEQLLSRNAEVVVFARHPMRGEDRKWMPAGPGKLHYHQGDVLKPENFEAVYTTYGITDVVHGAAFTTNTPESERQWGKSVIEVNCIGVLNSLAAAKDRISGRFVLLGSEGAYGDAKFRDGKIIEGETPFDPYKMYEISKFASERMLLRYAELFDMSAYIARIVAVYGPYEHFSGVRDAMSPNYQAISLARQGIPLRVTHPFRMGWIYATDVALAVLTMLTAERLPYRVVPVTTAAEWTILDWCDLLKTRYPDFRYEIVDDPDRVNLIGSLAPSVRGTLTNDRLLEIGFTPRFGLRESFDDYMNWLDTHPGYMVPEA